MKIAILLYPGVTALDAVGPYEVLSRLPHARVVFVGERRGPIRTDSRMLTLGVERTLDELPFPELLLIPGGVLGTFAAARDPRILAWVQGAHQRSRWTLSVCSGALILGAAGLLQGLTATTHWGVRDRLMRYGATYVPHRYIQHDRLITAAGVSAGIDMALFVAGQMVGEAEAQAIQLAIEYAPEPPFHAGSWQQAAPATIQRATQQLRGMALREMTGRVGDHLQMFGGQPTHWEDSTDDVPAEA